MNRYALIVNAKVSNITKDANAPNIPGQEWVECGDARIGDDYNNGAFSAPTQNIPAPNPQIPAREFWRRFPGSVREKLQNILATGTQPQKDKVNAFFHYVQASGEVDLVDPVIIQAVALIGSLNIPDFNSDLVLLPPVTGAPELELL